MSEPYEIDINKRLEYFEETNLFTMLALDIVKELGEFQASVNQLKDPMVILTQTMERAQQLIEFKSIAFFLVSEDDSDFYLSQCFPENEKESIEKEIDFLIEDGTFSRAVLEKKPITAYSNDFNDQLLLHVMTTASRVRGMFVGVLKQNAKYIKEASFELLSILIAHCSSTLESYELYHKVNEANQILQEKVQELSLSEALLKEEILDHQETEKALKASEKKYRRLTETAKEMIFTVSARGNITYSNKSSLSLSGYTKKQIESKNINELIDNFQAIFDESIQQDSETGIYDTELVTKSGDRINIGVSIVSISTNNYLIVGRDISERILAQKEKISLESKLWQAQKMESIGLLASGIAHDFNNLLSGIIVTSELALDDTDSPGQLKEDLSTIITASKRAKDLANKMYTIGRKDEHEKHRVNIIPVIDETIELVQSSLGRDKRVKKEIEDSELFIMGEQTRIQQILINLITNASHSMGEKEGEIVVTAKSIALNNNQDHSALDLVPGKYACVSVKDTGAGIPRKIVQKIFDPYFTTKKGEENAGLGLSVVHGIVESYGGAIEIDTEPDKGTSFHVLLPQVEAK